MDGSSRHLAKCTSVRHHLRVHVLSGQDRAVACPFDVQKTPTDLHMLAAYTGVTLNTRSRPRGRLSSVFAAGIHSATSAD
jgi:hypothetical protein